MGLKPYFIEDAKIKEDWQLDDDDQGGASTKGLTLVSESSLIIYKYRDLKIRCGRRETKARPQGVRVGISPRCDHEGKL